MARVAVWSTGGIGAIAIRAITARDDLELVAVWVHTEAKVGRDAGELVGVGSIGVIATGALADVLSARPDCVVYAATGPDLDAGAMPHYVALLEAGINVVTVSSAGLMFPDGWLPEYREQLQQAAETGGATIYGSGLEPGFVGDQLAGVLTTMSDSIRSIRTQEIFGYADYPNEFMMFEVFGFGLPMDRTPIMELKGTQLIAWGPPVQYLASLLGVTLDGFRETYDRRETPRDLHVAAGLIPAGTCGAIRMETIGVVDGRDAIIIEHVNRMAPDLAPDWPSAEREGTYRITIDGTPTVSCEL